MKRSVWISLAVFGLLCSLWVPSALGQAVYGSILGTVTDPSGAAVSGAKVTVTSETKNVSTETATNESGNYSVSHLTPDVYSVQFEAHDCRPRINGSDPREIISCRRRARNRRAAKSAPPGPCVAARAFLLPARHPRPAVPPIPRPEPSCAPNRPLPSASRTIGRRIG